MKTQVHLVSMPWGVKHIPSTQIGVLKAYVARTLPDVEVFGHHFHLNIPSEAFTEDFYWANLSKNFQETYYFYLVARRWGKAIPGFPDPEKILSFQLSFSQKFRPGLQIPEEAALHRLGEVTDRMLDSRIVGAAEAADKIVIGFTVNFLQTYAGIYAYFHLRETLKNKDVAFVFGGSSISYPQVVNTLTRLGLDAYGIIGEGEKKLTRFIENFRRGEKIDHHEDGVFHIQSAPDLTIWQESWFKSQVKSFDELPLPDYAEYFDYLDNVLSERDDWPRMRARVQIPVEGSRGCAFACEFCNLNRFWEGYRKLPGQEIAERVLVLSKRYKTVRVRFVDNLCDAWAKQYAEAIIKEGKVINSMMELRPKHTKEFYDVLAESGMKECQIGVEGLDESILKRVNKGTTVMDVVFNQKLLTEKMITKGSRQLITFYPKSTVTEVKNTRAVMEAMLHMPKIDMGAFALGIDSPIYRSLPEKVRKNLKVTSAYASSMPEVWSNWSVHFYLENPPETSPEADAVAEWISLVRWYNEVPFDLWVRRCLTIEGNVVYDNRSAEAPREIILDPLEETVYQSCHRPQSISALSEELDIPEAQAASVCEKLKKEKLLFEMSGKYLALALRLTKEQLANLAKDKYERTY